jgi:uncharacterized protein (TIGR02452 family)
MDKKRIAEVTLRIIESGVYVNNLGKEVSIKNETEFAVRNSKFYKRDEFPETFELEKQFSNTDFELTDETTLEASKRICKQNSNADPFVLNFASAKNPGGGFLGGAQAQEESLARSSSLYACLMANFEMYESNRRERSCFYSDHMIYSPKVPVFRNDDGSLLERPYQVSFLTSPAVNAGVVIHREPERKCLIESVNRERARKLLWVANKNNHETLVLGAWGCGVFRNDPKSISTIFAELLDNEFKACFERVIFAVYDSSKSRLVYNAFAERFGNR